MKFDFVVVGGGSAGVVTAYRLAEQNLGTVALIEAGPNDKNIEKVLELRRWPELLESELDYDYAIEPQQNGNSAMRHSRAKVLGGCSSHNSCIAFQAPDYDFENWASLGVEGWDVATVRASYNKMLSKVNLEASDSNNACGKAMIEAANTYGIPEVKFPQGHYEEGAGWFQLNKKGGTRHSSSVAYLHHSEQVPENLTVLCDTKVSQIVLDEERVVQAIETNQGRIEIGKELVVSTGAIDTPKLLMLSGIGPKKHLEEIGISVKVDLPGVGENLIDHPEGVIVWEASQSVPKETAQEYEIGLFCKVEQEAPIADLMFHFGTVAFDMHTVPNGYPTSENAFSLTPNVMRAKSQGTIRLRSANPADAPLVDPKYFTDAEGYDQKIMVEGIKVARKLMEQPAMKAWVKRELAPGAEVQTDEEIFEYIKKTHNTVYHPAGTCKMGNPEEELTVVDSALKVKGVKGLRVADASVFPAMVSTNPNLTCMMIGERCAELIGEEY
ncbi:GMC family oxidoreductase [Rapidithrix thailandica]|uniref:GMC family oxidoreductase n=1 Tax=Rapidithrix thailandica TaxID=413964 RepID=A0AAW9RY92_9BACT